MATVAFDTHAAVRELRAGGFDEDQAEKLVDVFSQAVGTPVTKTDLEPLATKSELAALPTHSDLATLATKTDLAGLATKTELAGLATKAELAGLATKAELAGLATKAELAGLEARLAWRLIGAGVAIAGIQAAAIVGLLRLVLSP